MTVATDTYLVYTTTEEGHGGVYLWWRPNRAGYTRFIGEAGRYTRAEAEQISRMRGQEGALPLAAVMEGATLKITGKLLPGVHGEPASGQTKPSERLLATADAVIDELKGRRGLWPDDLDEDKKTVDEIRLAIARIIGGAS